MAPITLRVKAKLLTVSCRAPSALSTAALIRYTPLACPPQSSCLTDVPQGQACSHLSLHLPIPPSTTLSPWVSHARSLTSLRSSLEWYQWILPWTYRLKLQPTCHFFSMFPSSLLSSSFSTNIFHILFAHLLPAGVQGPGGWGFLSDLFSGYIPCTQNRA